MLLRIDDDAGRMRALIVQYAVHAVVLGKTNCKFSADYPGVMQAAVERQIPGAQVMFVQGGAGDINPLLMGRTGDEATDFGIAQKMGELLAAEVLKANQKTASVEAGPIRSRSELLEFPNRWDKNKKLAVGITTVLIGKNIAIATVLGEPFHKLQEMWKSQADVAYPLFFGYTYSTAEPGPDIFPICARPRMAAMAPVRQPPSQWALRATLVARRCAGINRHVVGNERVLQERSSEPSWP